MKNNILFGCILSIVGWSGMQAQGFTSPSLQWNIPVVTDYQEYNIANLTHNVIDMNGDGKVDLVDTEDENSPNSAVFYNGGQKYWKVYLNTGNGFSATATQWNIPMVSDYQEYNMANLTHNVIDMNGDGKPDFVDSENQDTESTSDVFLNGGQKYWKVYLNNGAGFNATSIQWNIPMVSDYQEYDIANLTHNIIDMNGDMKPDFVDSEDQDSPNSSVFYNGAQKHWKVYINNGSGFNAAATQWNIPMVSDYQEYNIANLTHNVIDMNGDMKPDFVDSEDQDSPNSSVFYNGGQKHWKVYLNNGSGFNAAATQWNIPMVSDSDEYNIASLTHNVVDMNGDSKPDFVDTEDQDNPNSAVFYNGGQKHWKVYYNTGSGFNATATQWNIPMVSDYQEYNMANLTHNVIDFNGDLKPDFIDSENEATESVSDVFLNGSQKYWKVYINNATLGNESFNQDSIKITLYPNPVNDLLNIISDEEIRTGSIYNVLGQQVISKTLNSNEGQIDVSNLNPGTYFVKLDAGTSSKTLKVIKQ